MWPNALKLSPSARSFVMFGAVWPKSGHLNPFEAKWRWTFNCWCSFKNNSSTAPRQVIWVAESVMGLGSLCQADVSWSRSKIFRPLGQSHAEMNWEENWWFISIYVRYVIYDLSICICSYCFYTCIMTYNTSEPVDLHLLVSVCNLASQSSLTNAG